jgi:hypothetical protein
MKKIKSIKLDDKWNGKTIQEVKDYLEKEYPNQLATDSVDLYEQIPKDENYHFFFGSLFRYSDGFWRMPFVDGGSSGFYRGGNWLDDSWSGRYRVVLLETVDCDLTPCSVDSEFLDFAIAKLKKNGYIISKII